MRLHISWISACLFLPGCASLKTGLVTGAATTAVVGVASALMPAASAVPVALLGGTTAAIVSATSVATGAGLKGKNIMNDCAPDNFWSLLGTLIEMGGWALILIVIVPMLFSWLLLVPLDIYQKDLLQIVQL